MEVKEKEKNLLIIRYLDTLNIRHGLLGYTYLIACISILIDEPIRIKRITDVYEQVANSFSVDVKNLQRGIRTAILETGKPNKEFLAKAADNIRYRNFQNNENFARSTKLVNKELIWSGNKY